jgi:circadian clock protein KaiC
LLSTEFIAAGVNNNERCILFAFEENRELIFRNALNWSVDFRQMERDGKLLVVCRYPEANPLEHHLIRMQEIIEEFQPHRVAIDSLSALEWASSTQGFRQFLVGLNSMVRQPENYSTVYLHNPDDTCHRHLNFRSSYLYND